MRFSTLSLLSKQANSNYFLTFFAGKRLLRMTSIHVTKIGSVLPVVLFFLTSCEGQVKTSTPTEGETNKRTVAAEKAKTPLLQSTNTVSSIGAGIQDKHGNYWFGSNGDGIFYYDGTGFTHYMMEDGLNNNIVYSLLEDRAGRIWVGTKTGLNRMDPRADGKSTKVFEHIAIELSGNPTLNPVANLDVSTPELNGVWSMMQDKGGRIWLGTDDGVYIYDQTGFSRFLDNFGVVNKGNLQLKSVFSILQTSKGEIWFTACVSEGVSMFDGHTLTNIIPYEAIGRTDHVLEDKKGNLWFAAVFKGLFGYDGNAYMQHAGKEIPSIGPGALLEDDNGRLWFGTPGGLGIYDETNLQRMTTQNGLPVEGLCPVMKDKSGNLWFSTRGMGLYKYDGKTFERLSGE